MIDSNKFVNKPIENKTYSNPLQGASFKNSLFKRDQKSLKDSKTNLNEIEESL